MAKDTQTKAIVKMEVEIALNTPWDGHATLSRIHAEAIEQVNDLIKSGLTMSRLIGIRNYEVTTIVTKIDEYQKG